MIDCADGIKIVSDHTHFELVLTDRRGLVINPHYTRDMLKSIGKNEQQFCEWIGEENMAKPGYAYSMLVNMVDINKYFGHHS